MTVEFADVLAAARELLREQIRDPQGERNDEYTRGVVNLIAECFPVSEMDTDTRMAEIADEIGLNAAAVRMKRRNDRLSEGDRVEAVRFCLDEGLRIWPVWADDGKPSGEWRVVQVAGQRDEDIAELYHGQSGECSSQYPDAVYGINDNETVPPGTEGVVNHVTDVQVFVVWDNGAHLAFTDRDVYRKL